MVRLNRIYTRSGDGGTTGLGDGRRVPKNHPRVEAYGTADELCAALGVCLVLAGDHVLGARLRQLQNDLFDVGADLAVPLSDDETEGSRLRIGPKRVERLEAWIDEVNQDLPELESFILPGGNALSAQLHQARTVCRRAERRARDLADVEPLNDQCLVFLNRLSDLLFVYARSAAGEDEVLWMPTREDG